MTKNHAADLSSRKILHVLCKRQKLIVMIFGAIVMLTAVITFTLTPIYEATAQVLVKVGRENLYTPTTIGKESVEPKYFSEGQEAQTNSEVEILKSRILVMNVIQTIGIDAIYPDLVTTKPSHIWQLKDRLTSRIVAPRMRWLDMYEANPQSNMPVNPLDKAVTLFQKNLKIEAIKKTNVIHLTFQHKDSTMATKALDTLLSSYKDRHLQIHSNAQSENFLKDQLHDQFVELQDAQKRLADFKKAHAITSDPEAVMSRMLQEESTLRIAINNTLSEEADIKGRLDKLREQLPSIPKTIIIEDEESENIQALGFLQSKAAELEAKQTDLLSRYNHDNLLVINNANDLRELKARIAQQEQRKYSRVKSGLNNIYQQRIDDLLRNEANYKALNKKKEILLQQLSSYQATIHELDASQSEYSLLQQRLEITRQGYKSLLVANGESKMSRAMDVERITNLSIIDSAHASLTPVKPKKLLNIILSIFLGAIAGLGTAFALEYFNKTFETPEDVENILGLKVLSSVPDFTATSPTRLDG